MSDPSSPVYQELYTSTFSKNYKRYGSLRKKIHTLIDEILARPFSATEYLDYKDGKDLRGLRSARIDRNFRIIFCVWEEYQKKTGKTIPLLSQSMQEKLQKNSIVFITVGPHEKSYRLQ